MSDPPPLVELPPDEPGSPVRVANLAGDYSYMSAGYYRSLDLELAGEAVVPTTGDALDAYVVPIALTKAHKAGVAVPENVIVTDRFPARPFLAYPINPFSTRVELIATDDQLEQRRPGLTYTGKYAVLCQRLPDDYSVEVVRCVLGSATGGAHGELAEAVFRVFRLPLARARAVVTGGVALLSAIEPLPWRELSAEEIARVREAGRWRD